MNINTGFTFYTNKHGYEKKQRILDQHAGSYFTQPLCLKKKKVGENWNERINEKGLMSAKYSQRSQCPHLGTSTTPAGHGQRKGGRKGERKRKKASEKIKKMEDKSG